MLDAIAFTADGTTAALVRCEQWQGRFQTEVETVRLPSAAVARREVFADPVRRYWTLGRHAVGRRFALMAIDLTTPVGSLKPWQSMRAAYFKKRTRSLDGPNAAAEDDEPAKSAESLPGWALTTPGAMPAPVEWLNRRLPAGLGLRWSPRRAAARYETDAFAVDCEVPRDAPRLTGMDPAAAIAPDGRWLAVATAGGTLELWDTAPRLRWPWATAVGVIGGGAVAVVGRTRFRRATP